MKPIGIQKFYRANTDCPVFSELKSIAEKTFGVADIIRDVLKTSVAGQISVALIYGSIASRLLKNPGFSITRHHHEEQSDVVISCSILTIEIEIATVRQLPDFAMTLCRKIFFNNLLEERTPVRAI